MSHNVTTSTRNYTCTMCVKEDQHGEMLVTAVGGTSEGLKTTNNNKSCCRTGTAVLAAGYLQFQCNYFADCFINQQ